MAERIITPEAQLSYPKLFKPESVNGGEPKYGAAFVFAPGTDLTEMKKAAIAVATEKFGDKAAAMIRGNKLRMPFRTDSDKHPEGTTIVNARTDRKPGIVSMVPDTTKPRRADGTYPPTVITNEDDVYPGMIVRASLTPFYYDNSGNKGISFALGNIQKIRDGERLDSRRKAEDEFASDPTAVAAGPDGLEGDVADQNADEADELAGLI